MAKAQWPNLQKLCLRTNEIMKRTIRLVREATDTYVTESGKFTAMMNTNSDSDGASLIINIHLNSNNCEQYHWSFTRIFLLRHSLRDYKLSPLLRLKRWHEDIPRETEGIIYGWTTKSGCWPFFLQPIQFSWSIKFIDTSSLPVKSLLKSMPILCISWNAKSTNVACWCLLLLRMSGLIFWWICQYDGSTVVVLRAIMGWFLVSLVVYFLVWVGMEKDVRHD